MERNCCLYIHQETVVCNATLTTAVNYVVRGRLCNEISAGTYYQTHSDIRRLKFLFLAFPKKNCTLQL